MAFKLAIDNLVGVKIEGKSFAKDGAEKPFKFILVCERLTSEAMKQAISDKDETPAAFIEKHARDWQNQKLVQDEEGKPAPFGAEALAVLLSMQGMAQLCWHSYVQQVGATAKN